MKFNKSKAASKNSEKNFIYFVNKAMIDFKKSKEFQFISNKYGIY